MDGKKFKIKDSDLKAALGFAIKAITSKPVTPAFGDFVFKILGGDTLGVRALSHEIGAYIRVPAEAEEEFEFAVGANEIFRIANSLRGEIEFYFNEADNQLTVKPKRGKYKFFAQSAKDHPKQQLSGEEPIGKFNASDLRHGVSVASPFTAPDEHQPWKAFSLLDVKKENTTIVATNTWVLGLRSDIRGEVKTEKQVMIGSGASDLIRGMTNCEAISVSTANGYTVFRGGKEIVVQLNTTAVYPEYPKLFQKQNATVEVEKEDLIETLNRLVNVASMESHMVTIDFKPNEGMFLEASDAMFGKKGNESIPCSPTGTCKMNVNAKLLYHVVKARQSENLVIHYTSGKMPLMINGDDHVSNLIMPLI